ncbi:MAG: Ribosome maturation factor RimM [Pseudomonadota bacterium]|jgi:16S rRNA processing protein RimM
MSSKLICIGVVSEPYHLKGLVRISVFTDDPKSISGLKCQNEAGESLDIKFIKHDKKKIICSIAGITDRTKAEAIIGTKIYVPRDKLPELDDSEFYMEDLVGLDVIDKNLVKIGVIKGCHNFGAGDIIEISFNGAKTTMHPFTKESFPEIKKDYVVFISS